ncbi:MAG TPA: rhomboid family intramembrane serine protease [Bacillota bacterium]|nr:rhomboid family intramembrane serine protease [Bacillota bacterium]
MPFPEWFEEVILRLVGMGYEKADEAAGDSRIRVLIREEPLLRRIFILADQDVDLESLQLAIKAAISRYRLADRPIRMGILAGGNPRHLTLLSDISWVGAIWSFQEKGVRLIYQDGRWDVEDNLIRRRVVTKDLDPESSETEEAKLPVVSYAISIINLLLFVAMTVIAGLNQAKLIQTLLRFGAADLPRIWQGEYWRLLTPILLHVGFFPFFFTLCAYLMLGAKIERHFGGWRLLLILGVSGIWGVLVGILTVPHNLIVSSSAAAFGLLGAWIYWSLINPKLARTNHASIIVVLYIAILVIGIVNARSDNYEKIGVYSLLAGLICGALLAGIMSLGASKTKGGRKRWLIAFLSISLILSIAALFPSDSGWYIPFDRGRTALYQRDFDLAIDQLELSLARQKRNEFARFLLAQSYLDRGEHRSSQGDYSGAIDDFTKGIVQKDSWKLHYGMALAYYQLMRPEDTVKELKRALQLNPGNIQIRKMIQGLQSR